MQDALNFFDPNPDIPAYYENQLTRAFLVVLRLSPAAHQAWLSLAAPSRKLYQLPRPWAFDTQRWRMLAAAPDAGESIEGVSVLQAADAGDGGGQVEESDRAQVLDGIVRYGDELVIVIETKLSGRVPTRQAQYLNVHGADVRFAEGVKTVSWRELLAAWCDLIGSEVVTGTERGIIADFLDFVETHFPRLGPFTTLSRCKGNRFRVERRLAAAMNELTEGSTRSWIELPGRGALDRAILSYDEAAQQLKLGVWPADTLTQARRLYERPDAVARTLALQNAGWHVRPNYHFGFRASGLVWTTADAPVEDYAAYWLERTATTTPVQREDWGALWDELIQRRFAREDDRAQFDKDFTSTARNVATPRPGLACSTYWSLPEAERLDDAARFVTAVGERLNTVLAALGEPPLEARRSSGASPESD